MTTMPIIVLSIIVVLVPTTTPVSVLGLEATVFQAFIKDVKKVGSTIKLCSYYFSYNESNDINVTRIL